MVSVLYSEIDIICIAVTLILFWNDFRKSRGTVMLEQKLFWGVLFANAGAMVLDIITVVAERERFPWAVALLPLAMFAYYLIHPLVGYFWLLYVDFKLYRDRERLKRRLPAYSLFLAVLYGLQIANHWTGWIYTIDSNYVYHRGPLLAVVTGISFIYLLYPMFMASFWSKGRELDSRGQKELYQLLILFPVLPCIGGVLQVLYYGANFIFPGTTLCLLIYYIFVQNGQMVKDHLTGVYNRGQVEYFLNMQFKAFRNGRKIFLILLDMDGFKDINDTYGHLAGDDALLQTANILRSCCRHKEDAVARLGGDEFVVMGQCDSEEVVEQIVERMNHLAEEFNASRKAPYKISFSVGYTVYDGRGNETVDTLISEADKRMYAQKRLKKEREGKLQA